MNAETLYTFLEIYRALTIVHCQYPFKVSVGFSSARSFTPGQVCDGRDCLKIEALKNPVLINVFNLQVEDENN